jgi:predicted phospho-2-dehydro-3-deoxyheptonate aldolase
MTGKLNRLARILGSDRRAVIVPIDQSITSGPIKGLENMRCTIRTISDSGPDAILMHRGPVMAGLLTGRTSTNLIVHLSAGTQLSDDAMVKTCVCTVEDAIRMGADAVSVHVSLGLGNERDGRALADFGRISGNCQAWGMPLLAMMYVYGANHDKNAESVIRAARVGAELGADLIKVNYTGTMESFGRLIDTCYVPVLVAGGDADGDGYETLRLTEMALARGAAGVCVGRNVYQHKSPARMVRALSAVAHGGRTANQAYDEFIAPSALSDLEDDDDIFEVSSGGLALGRAGK